MQATRYSTGLTMALFIAACVILSFLPVPSWLKPLEVSDSDQPVRSLFVRIISRPQSVPRPSQGYVAGGGALDIADEDMAVLDPDPDDDDVPVELPATEGPRPHWEKPERPRFEAWAKRLGLEAAELDRGCAQARPDGDCERRALDRFFLRLRRVEAEAESAAPVRILHFGDSLIASDKITDRVRLRLQERFGSSGRGFLMIRKFNRFQRGHRTGKGSDGWLLDVITQSVLQDHFFGYTGASFTAQTAREWTLFSRLGGSRFVDVYYLEEAKGGVLDVLVDGAVVGRVDSRATRIGSRSRAQRFEIPADAGEVKLEVTRAGIRVYGAVLEAERPGVVYDSIGLPGATSEVWLRPDESDFKELLARRDPALVVHMVGGNDALMLAKRRAKLTQVEASMHAFFDRVAAAVPEADCLIVSPLEAVRAKTDGRMIPKDEVLQIIEVQRRVASHRGCGFWSMYDSMGGRGSLARWVQADLMLGDLIHPRSRGSDLLGEMMAESIMTSYDAAELALQGPGPEAKAGASR